MDAHSLSDRQRRALLRLGVAGMTLVVLAINGGRYLTIAPGFLALGMAMIILGGMSVLKQEVEPLTIRLNHIEDSNQSGSK